MGIGTSSKEDEEEESEQVPCSFPFWYEGRWRFECVRRTELESEDFWCPLTAGLGCCFDGGGGGGIQGGASPPSKID